VRWFAKFADGTREVTRTQEFLVDPAPQSNWGSLGENLAFGKSGTPFVVAAPGEALGATFRQTAWRSAPTGYCPTCITQFTSGVDTVAQTSCTNVTPSTNFPTYPGATVTHSISFNAPTQPGRYFVRFGLNFQFSCSTAGYGGTPMGVVLVR
jgi:hypothetical protein